MNRHPLASAAVLTAFLGSACPMTAQSSLATFYGDGPTAWLGTSVAIAGDVNGDGYDDVIAGGSNDSRNGSGAGMARVFSGYDGATLHTFRGAAPYIGFGYSVSGAGDVNADGYDDLVVGTPRENLNGAQSGTARIFSGTDGTTLHTLIGPNPFDNFGWSVASAGDVDGDGYDDVAIGIPGDDAGALNSGAIRVFSGRHGGALWSAPGLGSNDALGRSVGRAGDVNGDGVSDIVGGSPRGSGTAAASGLAFVLDGTDGTKLYTFSGNQTGDRFGTAVAGAGDVDDDGFGDVIIGASGDSTNGTDAGAARVYSGQTGTLLHSFTGGLAGDLFGGAVGGGGDFDGDGFDDLIVGAEGDDLIAQDAGSAWLFSGRTGTVLGTLFGTNARDNFGHSVASTSRGSGHGSLGDANADGFADFVSGAWRDDQSATDAGSVHLRSLGRQGTPPRTRILGAGCPTALGTQPRIDVRGQAALGETYTIALRGADPLATAAINIGLPANLPLQPFAPGCVLLTQPLVDISTVTDRFGRASAVMPFTLSPSAQALIGVEVEHQWITLSPGNNPAGIAASNAARLRVGS